MGSPGARKRYQIEMAARARAAREQAKRARLKRGTAKRVMALWNAALAAGWRTIFYPTVGTALDTGCHFLHVVCPACHQLGELDLRTIDIHPNAPLGAVVRRMSCRRCCPHPPFARPLGATPRSWLDELKWRPELKQELREPEAVYEPNWGRSQAKRKSDKQ